MRMSRPLRVALAQFDFPLGEVANNTRRIAAMIAEARDALHAQLVVFPGLALSGSPPLDLLSRPAFLAECARSIQTLASQVQGITAVVGWPCQTDAGVVIAASVLHEGRIIATAHACKRPDTTERAPRQDFHDDPDAPACTFETAGTTVGLAVGDDGEGTLNALAAAGATLGLVVAAEPFEHGALAQSAQRLSAHAARSHLALARCNAVGAQDAWIFHGAAQLADADGHLHPAAEAFKDILLTADFDPTTQRFAPASWPAERDASRLSLIWRALVAGIRGYARKNGFGGALLGLSGGLDSALVLALAVDALGAENVTAVRLPSRYTSALSNDLAQEQAEALGVHLMTLPIEATVASALQTLSHAAGEPPGLVVENLQSRARGLLLMGLSNATGMLLLSTGNKSEVAVGYCTLYGDTCGGYAPLKDLYKTEAFALSRWRNAQGDGVRIPEGVIARAPSAELREEQRDEDSLPPYAVLDALLDQYLEHRLSHAQLIEAGFDAGTVQRVLRLVRGSEWKRAQGAPGPCLSRSAFGSTLHLPVTSGYAG